MQPDVVHPFWGIMKELSIQFALGYDPTEFASSLHAIAEGLTDVTPMITGEVGLDGVAAAFDELSDPNRHCKIVVTP
jgi:threonine dehydrogenase-like Zn-dependent dehydrogenase